MKKFTLSALLSVAGILGAGATTPVTIPTTEANPFVISDQTVTFEVNSTFSPGVKDGGLDYMGEGDVAVFTLNNTEATAYKITFESATPQDVSNADFEILKGETQIYKKNAPIEQTGAEGGDWGNWVTNATLPDTPVLEVGEYTLRVTLHQGTRWETFTANIRNIAFTAVQGGQGGGLLDAQTFMCYWPGEDAEYGEVTSVEVDGALGSNNCVSYTNGMKVVLNKSDKSFSGANKITVGDSEYTTIKLSNGALNTLYAPEGKVINKLVLYSYINYNRVDKGSDGRTCFWAQIGDNTYTAETGQILTDYIDKEDYGMTPDRVEVAIPDLSVVNFKNSGEQVCFVLEVTYGEADNSGLNNVIATPVWEEGARYNLQGIRVDENYKGIVIMNGKKYINR